MGDADGLENAFLVRPIAKGGFDEGDLLFEFLFDGKGFVRGAAGGVFDGFVKAGDGIADFLVIRVFAEAVDRDAHHVPVRHALLLRGDRFVHTAEVTIANDERGGVEEDLDQIDDDGRGELFRVDQGNDRIGDGHDDEIDSAANGEREDRFGSMGRLGLDEGRGAEKDEAEAKEAIAKPASEVASIHVIRADRPEDHVEDRKADEDEEEHRFGAKELFHGCSPIGSNQILFPQFGQNLAPGASSAPQFGHPFAILLPQFGQNLAPGVSSAPQFGHFCPLALVPLGKYFFKARSTPIFHVLIDWLSSSNPPTSFSTWSMGMP